MNTTIKIPGHFSFKKLLYNKKVTVPFSIILAFILWLVIMIKQNPDRERTFSDIPVNINLENTSVAESGLKIIGDISQQKFAVVIRGPSYVVSSLKTSDFYVFASASTVNAPGEYQLEVAGGKNSATSDFEILSVTPSTVKVNFDYVDTKEFTIKANAEGAAAVSGLVAETAVVSGTESDTVTIKGPRTIINTIASVEAFAVVNETLSESKAFDAQIKLFDEAGKEIIQTGLTISATNVKVTVPISKKVTVPVIADFSNLPAGFSKKSLVYKIDHSAVTLIGIPEEIDKITQVSLSAIDITSISTSSKNSFDLSPKLPDGVRLFDAIDHFTVVIDTSGYAEKTFSVSKVRYTGLSGGLTAKSDTTIKNVKICGPKSVISKLKETDLYALVNLSDKKAGEHTVPANVKSDAYNNIWQVGTYSTTVKIN